MVNGNNWQKHHRKYIKKTQYSIIVGKSFMIMMNIINLEDTISYEKRRSYWMYNRIYI